MPKSFNACRKAGGKVRTKKLGDGKYMHVCVLGGKSYAGEVKTAEPKSTSTGSPVADAMKQKMKG